MASLDSSPYKGKKTGAFHEKSLLTVNAQVGAKARHFFNAFSQRLCHERAGAHSCPGEIFP
jgi:hypothetical protein